MSMSLKYTTVNIATEKQKVILGVEGNLYRPILISCIVPLAFLAVLPFCGWAWTLFLGITPFALTLSFVLLFLNRKPPCYLKDFVAKHISGMTSFNVKPRYGSLKLARIKVTTNRLHGKTHYDS